LAENLGRTLCRSDLGGENKSKSPRVARKIMGNKMGKGKLKVKTKREGGGGIACSYSAVNRFKEPAKGKRPGSRPIQKKRGRSGP